MKNPFGYLTAFLVEYTAFWYVHCNIACMCCFGFGSFLLLITMIKDITDSIQSISDGVKRKANRPQAVEKISDFIEFHSTLKQLSHVRRLFLFLFQIVEINLLLYFQDHPYVFGNLSTDSDGPFSMVCAHHMQYDAFTSVWHSWVNFHMKFSY